MTVLNRRSIRLPTGFLDNGVEGSTSPLLCGWYVRHGITPQKPMKGLLASMVPYAIP
jgi:hypothetical protein